MLCASALFRNLTGLEETLEEFVCVRCGPAGIFRDSHIVAFHWKVMDGQGYVGVSAPACPSKNSVCVTSVRKPNQVFLFAGTLLRIRITPMGAGEDSMLCKIRGGGFNGKGKRPEPQTSIPRPQACPHSSEGRGYLPPASMTLFDCVTCAASFADLRQIVQFRELFQMHLDRVAVGAC